MLHVSCFCGTLCSLTPVAHTLSSSSSVVLFKRIPRESTIPELKQCLIQHANDNLLSRDVHPCKVAKAWVVMAMFGYDDMYDIPLEVEAVELKVQLKRIKSMFGLTTRLINGLPHVVWNEKCRFALVIFSVVRLTSELSSKMSTDNNEEAMDDDEEDPALSPNQIPWTFCHEERLGAPSTLLENTLKSTHLRAWDFVTGEALASSVPTVFSFAEDPRDKRAFMMMSKSANTLQQFCFGGEGDILGMGENAIVHRVQLSHTKPDGAHRDENWTRVNIGLENSGSVTVQNNTVSDGGRTVEDTTEEWDAAVKRPFSLAKMLSFLQNSSEAGLAKRLRLANLLNSDKRVLYFYGLGLGLSTNAYNQNEYKFELMLLSKYEEEFSTYTMREFMEEYIAIPGTVEEEEKRRAIKKLQSELTITAVKVFLVSLLNAFRDLTLMGVQAFDFNHLNNVLVSRDYRQVRLIDIDGNAQGSIDYPAIDFTTNGSSLSPRPTPPQRPCLDVDLNILLPSVIEQLMLGKGRGKSFVSNKRSEIWHAKEEDGKEMLRSLLMENFYSTSNKNGLDDEAKAKLQQHVKKLAEWFYALLKKQSPWNNWTHDIYDAMRCIDHLPIS